MTIKATLLTIGDEILIGQIVDTNSAFIAQQLNSIGIVVEEIMSIQDEVSHIVEALERSVRKSNVIIVTGGLGPTKDDKTKLALCKFLDCNLYKEEKVLANINRLFINRGFKSRLNKLNKDQALIPEKSSFIQNTNGTAPCLWTAIEGNVIINLPGVPYEMKAIMTSEIIPRLQRLYNSETIVHRDILITGISESDLAILIEDWENNLPKFIHLAYLPSRSSIDLRFSAIGSDKKFLEDTIQENINKLKLIAGKYILSENSGTPHQVLGDVLNSKKLTISVAESCTGGNISKLITSLSGSSNYFSGSVVSYSTSTKISVLGTSRESIEEFTVVSKEVSEQMAKGVRKLLNTDIAISTTGVAGPNKGEDGKDIGTAWISITDGSKTISEEYNYPYLDREDFIKILSNNAFNLAVRFIKET